MQLRGQISTVKSRVLLIREIKMHIQKTPFVICPALNRRKVFTAKWLGANIGRGRGVLARLQSFFVALEVLRRSEIAIPNPKNMEEWELTGETTHGEIVKVHVREEKTDGKNRLLFFISSFHKEKSRI